MKEEENFPTKWTEILRLKNSGLARSYNRRKRWASDEVEGNTEEFDLIISV